VASRDVGDAMSTPLYDDAKAAINRLFSDTSVPQSETHSMLLDLRDEIDVMMAALEDARPAEPEEEDQ
jgi:hypothetical protein